MLKILLLIATILLYLMAAPYAQAANTASVLGASLNINQPQVVNVTSTGITLSYTVNPQSINTICWPLQDSINSSTVSLTSANDDRHHPIYTVSWSKSAETVTSGASTINYFKFKLSIPQSGYELLPNTTYVLKLEGGSSGIEFICQNGSSSPTNFNYFLPSTGFAITFNTGEDTVAPVITEHSLMNTQSIAVLGWITSELAQTQISYGTTSNYGLTKSVPGTHEKHFIELNNLQPGTTYYYQLESKDADGMGIGTRKGTFTTWSISPITISEITGHEATLKWTTNPETDSIIEYGTSPNLGQISGKHGLASNHDVRLVHLQSNKTYYARIRLINGDASSVSAIFSFKTIDASAGVSADTITINPEFAGQFDLSNFNFKDFPEEVSELDNQASSGAVLAETDADLFPIAGNFGAAFQRYTWAIWLWVPVLLLLFLIACIWLLHRHQHNTSQVQQEIVEQKISSQNPQAPPQIH